MTDKSKKREEDLLKDLATKYNLKDIDVFTAEKNKAEEELMEVEKSVQEQYHKTKSEALYNRDMAMRFLEERSRNSRFLNLGRELASIQNAYLNATTDAESKYNLGMIEIKKQRKDIKKKYDFQDVMYKFNHGMLGGKSKRDFLVENKDKFGESFAEMISNTHKETMQEFSRSMINEVGNIKTQKAWEDKIDELQNKGMNLDDATIKMLKQNFKMYSRSDFKREANIEKGKIENMSRFEDDAGFYKNTAGEWIGEVKGGEITNDGKTKTLFAELTEAYKKGGILNEQVFAHRGSMYVTRDNGITFKTLEIARYFDNISYDKKDTDKDGNEIIKKGTVQNNAINTFDHKTSGLFTINGSTYKVADKFFSNVKSGAVLGEKLFGADSKKSSTYLPIYEGFMNAKANKERMIHLLEREKDSKNHTVGAKAKFERAIKELNNGEITSFALAQYIRASRTSNKGNKNTVTHDNSIVGYAHGKYWTILDGKLYELVKK